MVLARKGRTAQTKQPVGEGLEMAHGWPMGEGVGAGGGPEPGVPRAVFLPHANSLHFEERQVSLEQPVKIGRNVYRAAPTPTNTIFECRVLSRHHATLWYEKGHFYIMDNQSSNGTFINNNRCSIGKENEPYEVFSGDVLQFGIAVVENQTNQEKNTFLPVVALLKLFLPDGKEAKLTFNPAMTTPLHLKELYQLNNFLQEAVSREAALEARLRTLRECVERTRAEALAGWELLVGEQRLLARVHALEATVAAGKPITDKRMQELITDKNNYQEVAQESLRQAHEQRLTLEEALEKKSREAHALHQHNCDLRLTTNHALAELQKLAARCERKICAAKIAIASAEEREAATRARMPLAMSKMNGEACMLVTSWDGSGGGRDEEPETLAEAVRTLPDYIKILLPDHMLAKVGIKAINVDAKNAKECEMIVKKNELINVENRDKVMSLEERVLECLDLNYHKEEPAAHNSDENGTLNHDSSELNSTEVELEMNSTQLAPDNNANSTFRRVDNHNDVQSNSKNQQDVSNWLVVLTGLKEEVRALRARLAELASENEKLRSVRDQLLDVKLEVQEELNERSMLEQAAAADDCDPDTDTEKHDPESHKELVARLERALVAERELAVQLAQRPTTDTYSELALTCQKLKDELHERNQLLEELRTSTSSTLCDRAVNTSVQEIDIDEIIALNELDEALGEFGGDESVDDEQTEFEDDRDTGPHAGIDGAIGKLYVIEDVSVDFDEAIGKLDVIEDDVIEDVGIDSAVEEAIAEVDKAIRDSEERIESNIEVEEAVEASHIMETRKERRGEGEGVQLQKEARAVAAAEASTLLALQDELVRVKEHWAEARAECARLQGSRRPDGRLQYVAYAVALFAAAVYSLLYHYVS